MLPAPRCLGVTAQHAELKWTGRFFPSLWLACQTARWMEQHRNTGVNTERMSDLCGFSELLLKGVRKLPLPDT